MFVYYSECVLDMGVLIFSPFLLFFSFPNSFYLPHSCSSSFQSQHRDDTSSASPKEPVTKLSQLKAAKGNGRVLQRIKTGR